MTRPPHDPAKVVSAGSYANGCRCDDCTGAHSRAVVSYERNRRTNDPAWHEARKAYHRAYYRQRKEVSQ